MGKDILEKPTCPFCSNPIDRPKELVARMPNEMPVGSCSCGAVYAFDVTGHNLGAAMVDALVFGCNGDWDLAWGLLPEEDYLEKEVKNYDIESHLIIHGTVYQGRRITGTLYFIRLHEDVLEVTGGGVKKQFKNATPVKKEKSRPRRGGKSLSKKEVENLVLQYDMEAILKETDRDDRLIRYIQRLLYAVDPLLRLRAADSLGRVAAVVAERDPGAVSRLLQGFFTSIADTAASSWGALDAIGEIIRNSPEQYAGFIPQLYRFTKDRVLAPGVLRVLGRIAAVSPHPIRKTAFHYIPLLQDTDPEIRGYAAVLLGNLMAQEAEEDLKRLKGDETPLDVYEEGFFQKKTIDQLAAESLAKL